MPRVVVVGHPGDRGPLPSDQFANMLASRLGTHHVPLSLRAPDERNAPAKGSRLVDSHWVVSEPAGAFTEGVFREADTVVWLHFSPLPFVRDWFANAWERFKAALIGHQNNAPRARWNDVVTAFGYLMIAPEMYKLFEHPALSHVKVIELRTPEQAEFWLLTQRKRHF